MSNENGTEHAGGGLDRSARTEEITATSLGISISDNVRRYVNQLPDGAELTRGTCYDWFVINWPDVKKIAVSSSFRQSISITLNRLCGKKIIHVVSGGGTGNRLVYRKGNQRVTESDEESPINLGTLENLVAEGYSKTEVCAALGISESTLMRYRHNDSRVQAAWDGGLERFQRNETRDEAVALLQESTSALLPVERLHAATRAAAVELAYVETWGEHSPKSTEVLRMVVEAAKS